MYNVRKISIEFDQVPVFDQFNLRGIQYRKGLNGEASPLQGHSSIRLPRGVIVRWVGVQPLPARISIR